MVPLPTMQHADSISRNQQAVSFKSVMSCDVVVVLSWVGMVAGVIAPDPPTSSSDGDEASLVAADGLWHHAATPPPGHTPLPVEFSVATKP